MTGGKIGDETEEEKKSSNASEKERDGVKERKNWHFKDSAVNPFLKRETLISKRGE